MKELENFLAELKNNPSIKSIILFGSQARGNARENSDVDLIVVCDKTKRGIEERNGQYFELVYVTEEDAQKFYSDNEDNAVNTWKSTKVLFDADGSAERIRNFVLDIEQKGKKKLGGDKLNHLRFDIEDSLRTIETNISKEPTETQYFMGIKIKSLLELFFDVRGIWKPAPKQLLGEINKIDKEIYILIKDFYEEQSLKGKLTILRSLSDKVFA